MEPIHLLLVDDHSVVRSGLKAFLNTLEDLEVIGEAENGISALEQMALIRPDVVVMDISMPGMDGLEATRLIVARVPNCKVLALTVHTDRQFTLEMLAAGASGYISKLAQAEELVSAIRIVASGGCYLQPLQIAWLVDEYRRLCHDSNFSQVKSPGFTDQINRLSKREQQVLDCVARGWTNKETGELLHISHKTVARHRERIMAKLGLHSCAELVRFSIQSGIIKI